ncbi:TetR/AcrR family transcriptional regulator [Dermatophilaceae bacterium Soc4.6]
MGHRHSKQDLLDGAVALALEEGLAHLSFGRVARRAGVSDRIVVYYFPSREVLVTEVFSQVAARLQTVLLSAFATPVTDHLDLIRTAWPVLAHPDADPVFALYFEAAGMAVGGHAPFHTLVPELVRSWVSWAAELLPGSAPHRTREAEAAIALIDGLLLLRQLLGPQPAARAFSALTAAEVE